MTSYLPWKTNIFQIRVYHLGKVFAPWGGNSFLLDLTPSKKEGKSEINIVYFPLTSCWYQKVIFLRHADITVGNHVI